MSEKSIEIYGADKGIEKAASFVNPEKLSEGYAILHAYETYVPSNEDTHIDKVAHFVVSAKLQYNNSSFVTDIWQYGKEIIRDEIPSWFSNDKGYDPKDMIANNRGQQFGRQLLKKHHPERINRFSPK